MTVSVNALAKLPLFAGFTPSDIEAFLSTSVETTIKKGEVLFAAGARSKAVYLLVSGSLSVTSDEEEVLVANPPSFIGELSALTDEDRSLTATAAEDSIVMAAPVEKLRALLQESGGFVHLLQTNMLRLAARKIGRDRARLHQMKENIVNTQRAMKAMRDALLESEDNPLHASLFEELDSLIEHNRRVHYMVEPSRLVPTSVRLDDGTVHRVAALSNEWVHIDDPPKSLKPKEEVRAVLLLDGEEIAISGVVARSTEKEASIFLDGLMAEYDASLTRHLTRAQLLDVVL